MSSSISPEPPLPCGVVLRSRCDEAKSRAESRMLIRSTGDAWMQGRGQLMTAAPSGDRSRPENAKPAADDRSIAPAESGAC